MTAVEPCGLGRPDIEELARKFRELHVPPGCSIQPHSIAIKIGCRVETVLDSPATSLEVRGPGDFTISISSYTSFDQDRRTIGHELGHYVLHSKCGSVPMSFPRFGEGLAEWEANWFWMALLNERTLRRWLGEVCKRCGRRNCIGFNVPDETWAAVVRGRWSLLCTTCFDEEAEAAGVAYEFGEVFPVSWSDWNESPLDEPLSPEAQAGLDVGLKSARENPPVDMGSFSKYADDDR